MSSLFAEVWPGEADDPALKAWEGATGDRTLKPDVAYRHRLIDWCVDRMGIPRETLVWSLNEAYGTHRWDGTTDPLVAIAKALEDWSDVGVESGTGTGKSFFAALVILWFLACWEGARVFTFAPKEDQLRLFIWMELGKLWPKFVALFPTAELTDLTLRMRGGLDDSWAARGYAVGVRAGEEVATKAAGMHAADMLIIGEETPGIPKPIITAHENTCTAPHNLRLYLGNPDNQQDTLHQICQSPGVVAIRISAHDHPNVVADNPNIIPGAVSRKAIERRRKKYGVDSPLYGSRVRGISPLEAENALIKAAWVQAAQARYLDPKLRRGKKGMGVDVANSDSGDQAAIARGIGACCLEVDAFACPDANVLGTEIVAECRADGVDEAHVGVDAGGVGAGTINEAKRLGFRVQALHSGPGKIQLMDEDKDTEEGQKKAANVERFGSRRSAFWWQLRMDLQRGKIALPPGDDELLLDLVALTWEVKNGAIHVEKKEDVRERLGRSPNKGDACAYWNWTRDRRFDKEDEDANEIDVFAPEILKADAEERNKMGRRIKRRRSQKHLHDQGDY